MESDKNCSTGKPKGGALANWPAVGSNWLSGRASWSGRANAERPHRLNASPPAHGLPHRARPEPPARLEIRAGPMPSGHTGAGQHDLPGQAQCRAHHGQGLTIWRKPSHTPQGPRPAKGVLPLAVWLDGDRSHGQAGTSNQASTKGKPSPSASTPTPSTARATGTGLPDLAGQANSR